MCPAVGVLQHAVMAAVWPRLGRLSNTTCSSQSLMLVYHLSDVAVDTQLMIAILDLPSTAALGWTEAEKALPAQGSLCLNTGDSICLSRALGHV